MHQSTYLPNPRTFTKFDIALPGEIKDFYNITPADRHAELHQDFKQVKSMSCGKISLDLQNVLSDRCKLRSKISTMYCFVSSEFPLFLEQAIHAARIDFVKEPGVLRVISRDPSSQRRSAMLQEMHFRNIAQRSNLRKRTEEAARHLEATRLQVRTS